MFDIKLGLNILKQNVKIAPEAPGIYRMLNEKDEVLCTCRSPVTLRHSTDNVLQR